MLSESSARREHMQLCLLVLLTVLIQLLPIWIKGLPLGHDSYAHISRIENLAYALPYGYPVRCYPLMYGGYGYAFGLFYPDLTLLPAAIVRAMGAPLQTAMICEVVIVTVVQTISCYSCAKAITKSRYAGWLFAVLFCFCQYRWGNFLIRAAMGEWIAMCFLPMIVHGLWNLTEEENKSLAPLIIGFSGLMLTHTISLAIMGVFSIAWVIIRSRRFFHRDKILATLRAAACVLLLTCWFYLPFIEQLFSDRFAFQTPWVHLSERMIPPETLLDAKSYLSIGLGGLALLAAVVGYRLFARQKAPLIRLGWVLICVGLLMMLLTTSLFPWQLLDNTPVNAIQFPWRTHGLSQMLICLGAVLLVFPCKIKAMRVLSVCFVIGVGLLNLGGLRKYIPYTTPDGFFLESRAETIHAGLGEWLPEGTDTAAFMAEPSAQWSDENGSHLGQYLRDGSFVCDEQGGSRSVTAPKLWYKGYAAELVPTDGNTISLPVSKGEGGRVLVTLPDDAPSGTLRVFYRGTLLQYVSCAVSLAALVFLGVTKKLGKRRAFRSDTV